jgi:iron complex transport system ATP-binding protein
MMLEVKDISYAYDNERTIFSNIEFTLNKGEILTILGPNGSGKTTLLNCLANIFVPSSGEILIKGVPFAELSLRQVAQMIICGVFFAEYVVWALSARGEQRWQF